MTANPMLGVFLHWLGGLSSASFYLGYRGVKLWAWETYWLAGGVFSWIIMPWLLALTMTNDLFAVLRETPGSSLFWAYVFGVLWGTGGLTFGLTMRSLGLSLGMAVALGYTAAFGTLLPPIFRGEFAKQVLGTHSGMVILSGVAICLTGIAFAGAAGISKERELSEEQKRAAISEFSLKRGLLVATFCGIMSACFAYGLAAGDPIKQITLRHGTPVLWQGLPVLVVVLVGGFTTNFIWCMILNIRNRTSYQYFSSKLRGEIPARAMEPILESVIDAPGEEMAGALSASRTQPERASALFRAVRVPHAARKSADARQLLFLRHRGYHLVHAVLLLHHGRNADGQLQVLELDAAHGKHHHLQHAVGNRAERVEGRRHAHQVAGRAEPVCAGGIHGYCRLRELSRTRRAVARSSACDPRRKAGGCRLAFERRRLLSGVGVFRPTALAASPPGFWSRRASRGVSQGGPCVRSTTAADSSVITLCCLASFCRKTIDSK